MSTLFTCDKNAMNGLFYLQIFHRTKVLTGSANVLKYPEPQFLFYRQTNKPVRCIQNWNLQVIQVQSFLTSCAKLIVYAISSAIRESYNVTLRYDSTELPLTLDRWFFSEVNYLKSDTFGCRFPASFNLRRRRESPLTPFLSTNANHVSIVYMSSLAYNQHSRFNILLICFLYTNKGDHCIKYRLATFFVRFRISSICMTISSHCNESFIVYAITAG